MEGVNVAVSVTVKLCPTNYFAWKQLMIAFLNSRTCFGYVDGTTNPPDKLSWLWESPVFEEDLPPNLSPRSEFDLFRQKISDAEKKCREDWNQKYVQQWDLQPVGSVVDRVFGTVMGPAWYRVWGDMKEWVREQEHKEECEQEQERREEWEESQEEQERRQEWDRERERRKVWDQEFTKWEREGKTDAEWKEQNDRVRGWLLATVSEELLPQVMGLPTARQVWIKLEKIFTPPFQLSHLQLIDWTDKRRGQELSKYAGLHKAVLTNDWDNAATFFDQEPDAVFQPITWCLETALIVAVRSAERNDFINKLIEKMQWESGRRQHSGGVIAQKDISGATALHAAVGGGNIAAANLLVQKDPGLANNGDTHETLPVHVAAGLGNRKMVNLLLEPTTTLSENESGLKLLHSLASSGLYDIALIFLQRNPKLASMEPSPLVVMAQKRTSFLSGTSLNWNLLQRLIYFGIPSKLEDIANQPQERDIENPAKCVVSTLIYGKQKLNALFWDVAEKLDPFNSIKSLRQTKLIHRQALNLVKCICKKVVETDFPNAAEIFTEPLQKATCVGIHEIVEEILESFPSAIHLRREKDQSLFQLAIVYRRANIFNLIYQMKEDRRAFLSIPDVLTNNALHSAGNLAEQQLLLLRASAAGAALQMQRELQWFKEVGNFLLPQAKEHMNAEGKTPQEVFTETHKDLVKEGEQWMKDTANSCTIVAALITTIVFAAAITVPGGSFSDNSTDKSGLPIRLGDRAFTWFGISDALALFSSSASLLMFLSILTSRYGEQDFMYSLPRRLIIGLFTLFLSIISMMVAFGATLKIVFGEKKAWIVYPVAFSCCVPVTLFALLQFRLLYAMIKSTYFPGLFGKQSNRILH